jgi:branched-chain amino acid transport system permease protein
MLQKVLFVLVYGLSFGMMLFLISVGLAVTMGVMRVVNLAHGAFAATGAYLAVHAMSGWGLPLPLAVIVATAAAVAISLPVERVLYRPIYGREELDQVLLTIGIVYVSIAGLTYFFGPDPVPATLPRWLYQNVSIGPVAVQGYRLAVAALGAVTIGLLWLLLRRTSFGVRLRAAVDNPGMAQAVGINVNRVYTMAFALGAALAALGGAAGYALIQPEPTYAFKYLTLILFVVGLAGPGRILECAAVALGIGMVDTAARYIAPQVGGYIVYVLAIILMIYRSRGVFHAR